MNLKILITMSSIMPVWEPCAALVKRLLAEGQKVGVLGPTGLYLGDHENLQVFDSLSEAKDFEPNITLPLDPQAAAAIFKYWTGPKHHSLYKDELSLALNHLRSFGLSILASAGLPTVQHMVLANSNDVLRFEARKKSEMYQDWQTFHDHPLSLEPVEMGSLAVAVEDGKRLSFCILVSDSKPLKEEGEDAMPAHLPPIAFSPLRGLLRRGGVKDFRGVVAQVVKSPAAMTLSKRVKAACQSVGLKGVVFLDVLYPEGDSAGQAIRLYAQAPAGFLSLLLHSGILSGKFHETLNSLLKDKRFPLTHEEGPHVSLVVGDPSCSSEARLDLPEVVSRPFGLPVNTYELGYLTLNGSMDIPEGIWEQHPTAEVKLDLQESLKEFSGLLKSLGLVEEVQ